MSSSSRRGPKKFVVMGAGEVGFHLARTLSNQGHAVTVIEISPQKLERLEEELDVRPIEGNGAHPPILAAAEVSDCDLFMAVSSSDEANLTAAIIAKHLGAERTVVRVGVADEVIADRRLYEELFGVDLLLSTQLLTTTRILNRIRGHSTMAVEYLAGGKVQVRKIKLDDSSPLTHKPLKEISLPRDSLVVAFFRGDDLVVPGGNDRAEPGDSALILCAAETMAPCEKMVSASDEEVGDVVIAGGGQTAQTVARALSKVGVQVKIVEKDRGHAKHLATRFPECQVIHGDATDLQLLRSERMGHAHSFVALTGEDESNLLACLLAQELGIEQVLALVQRLEATKLWRRLELQDVFSPRALAYQRIREYIDSDYSAAIVSLARGKAQVLERRLEAASPAAGVTLVEIQAPRGLIVGAVVRGQKVFVPRGKDRLEAGDLVILFVQEDELPTVNLLFPARQRAMGARA